MRKISVFLLGMFFGGLLGGGLGMLLAPYSGPDLQNRIQQVAGNAREEIVRSAQQRRRELQEELASLRLPFRENG